MKLLVTGAAGRLGSHVVRLARAAGQSVVALDRAELDLAAPANVFASVLALAPFDAVINCAAWTAVDACEADPELANAINGLAVGELARACASVGARLIQVSTDYVFPGKASGAYAEDDAVQAQSVYGSSKLLGEQLALAELPAATQVVRTAWLYGQPGHGFVEVMLGKLRAGDSVQVVNDQFGQPTWAEDLAAQLVRMLDAPLVPGVFHGTNSGEASWFDMVRLMARVLGVDEALVQPVSAAAFPRPALRPSRTVLAHGRWAEVGLPALRAWDEALMEYVLTGGTRV